jgi:lipopolysaccharide transport system permease protein
LIQTIKSLAQNRSLLRDFVVRDLKARYVGSSMGFFWSVVYPIMNLFVYLFVFQIVLKMTWSADKSSQEVVLLMLVGIVAWTAFAETLSRATNTLVDNANLIQKVVFPSEILPVYITISALVNLVIALPVVGLALTYGMLNPPTDPVTVAAAEASGNLGIQVGLNLAWLPLLLILQGVFTAGLAYFLATFNLFWRDTIHIIGVAVTVLMFLTPIFYPAEKMVAEGYGWMLTYNPMHWLLDMYRGVMVKNLAPDLRFLAQFTGAAALSFFVGSQFFSSQRERFPDLL